MEEGKKEMEEEMGKKEISMELMEKFECEEIDNEFEQLLEEIPWNKCYKNVKKVEKDPFEVAIEQTIQLNPEVKIVKEEV